MYKLCKTEQSAQRQRQLEEGLLTAMLTQRYEDISICDLCNQMGVPRKSFYRYFSSKDDALHALIDHRLMEFEARSHPGKIASMYSAFLDLPWFFEYWHGQKRLLDALNRNNMNSLLIQRAIAHSLEDQFLSFHHHPESREYQQHAVSFVVCGLMSMMLNWHHEGYPQSPNQMAQISAYLLSHPLMSEQNEQ